MSAAHEVFNQLAEGSEGGTVRLSGLPLPSNGYYVGGSVPSLVFETIEDANHPAALLEIAKFVESSRSASIGWWVDEEDDKVYVDAVDWYQDEYTAAAIGRVRREIAIWDIARECELRLVYASGE